MKALVLNRGGSIDGFEVADRPVPEIGADELLVRVHAVGLNPSDYQTAEYLQGEGLGIVLGLDVAGEVVRAGAAVRAFKPGDRVFYIRAINNPHGGFAEYALTPERFACRIPDGLSYEEAALLPGAGLTAYHIMFCRFRLRAGRSILIQGGAGGVGSFALQMAKNAGLRVIATCKAQDIPYVLELGADVAIDYQNEDVYARIRAETRGAGLDYALSSIGPEGAARDLQALRFGAELALTAGLPDFSGWRFYERGLTVHEIAFGAYLTSPDPEDQALPAALAGELAGMVSSGKIRLPHFEAIPLHAVPDGLRRIKRGEVRGKLLARVAE